MEVYPYDKGRTTETMMNITRNSWWGSPSPKYDSGDRGNAVKCTQEVDGGAY
jgi:hypothetical protein